MSNWSSESPAAVKADSTAAVLPSCEIPVTMNGTK
jgi:hypothetical protein